MKTPAPLFARRIPLDDPTGGWTRDMVLLPFSTVRQPPPPEDARPLTKLAHEYAYAAELRARKCPVLKPGTPNLIMALPPELRNEIYEMAMTDIPRRINMRPGLLAVSRTIRAEAWPFFYTGGDLYINAYARLGTAKFVHFTQHVGRIVETSGKEPFWFFTIHIGSADHVWKNLDGLLPLLEVIRSTGFRCERKHALRLEGAGAEKLLEDVLFWAVGMGRRAAAEKWEEAELAERFTKLVNFALSRRAAEAAAE